MFEKKYLKIAALTLAAFVQAMPSFAQEAIKEMPVLDCEIGAPAPENSCLLRLPASYKSSSVSATKDNGENYGASWEFIHRGYFSGNQSLSGTLILVDITLGKGNGRKSLFGRKERDFIHSVVEQLPNNEAVAVYTFDTEIKKVSDFTTNRTVTLNAVDSIELTGIQTWIGSNIVDAVSILKANDDIVMKSIIVVSDGLDESKVSSDEVIASALDGKVSVSALGAFWRPQGHADNGTGGAYLNKIAKRTLGEYVGVTMGRADADKQVQVFAEAARSSRSESSLVSLKQGEPVVPGTITVTVDRPVLGDAASTEQVEFTAQFTPEFPDTPLAEDMVVEEVPGDMVTKILTLLKEQWYFFVAGALVLILIIFFLMRRGSEYEEDELGEDEIVDIDDSDVSDMKSDSTEIFDDQIGHDRRNQSGRVVAPQRVAGYLLEKSSGQRLPLKSGRTTIGRGSQSDIVVADSSVSRAHATVVAEGGGVFLVTDLSSLNGTYINDQKVEGEQRFRGGDVLRLGEYSLVLEEG